MAHPPWHRTARMIGGTPWVPYQIAASLQQELEKQANIENQARGLQQRARTIAQERDQLRDRVAALTEERDRLRREAGASRETRALQDKVKDLVRERDRLHRQVDDLAHENQRLQENRVDQSLELRRELEALRAENARLLQGSRQQRPPEEASEDDKIKRLAADLANVRRRTSERIHLARREEKVVRLRDLAEIIDDLTRALEVNPDHDSDWYKGHKAILARARHAMTSAGGKAVGKVGEAFDPKVHEAVAHTPADAESGTIVHVQEPGYQLEDGALVRPARVVVAD